MLRVAACVLALAPSQAPLIRVESGAARLAEGRSVRVLERDGEAVALARASGWIESGARTAVVLAWRGLASARIDGPAAFQVERSPGLVLADFRSAELEVRRGTLVLDLDGAGRVELGPGALQVRALPGGVLELLNRGGAALELRRADGERVLLPSWRPIRIRLGAAAGS